ncbi:Uncharacterized protein FWK35_00031386 [Aphis craccivora]|uniref:Uncharacterized protein n=1 Tax=Aphis craccivora TaxID=307492 RepID=A0A6G0Y8G9_APHCR|nr:Uncharacterized protein FWK35_00031386 [Aphis craccivora]
MYGPVFDDNEQKWLRRSNEDLKNLYSKEDIVQFVRSSRLSWAGHAWRADGYKDGYDESNRSEKTKETPKAKMTRYS